MTLTEWVGYTGLGIVGLWTVSALVIWLLAKYWRV